MMTLKWMVAIAIASTPVSLAAQEKATWSAPATATVVAEALTFESDGARLSGTLYRPAGKRNLPAMVVLHGAGAPLRSAPLYRHLYQALPQLGMAVFVYDRRGSGSSPQGKANPGDFDQLAADGGAALAMLARNPAIDARRIGFWGLSQGGWLALLAAAKTPRAAFVVAASAPMAAADVQMNFAVANILRIRGYPQAILDKAIHARSTVDDYRRGKASRADAEAAEASIRDEPWYKDTWIRGNIDDPEWLQQITADPLAALDKSRVPTLILYGQRDPWVPVATSVAALARTAARHPNVTTRVIDEADHAMAIGIDPAQQIDPKLAADAAPNAPAYFMALAAWLERRGLIDRP